MVVSAFSCFFDKEEYILKLGQKKWKSLVSGVLLAASASSFLIAPVFASEYAESPTSAASEGFYAASADEALEFTTTLTGVSGTDAEYADAGIIQADGNYKFTKDASITTTNAHGSDMNQATTIDAKGKTLTFNTDITDRSTIHAIGANSTDGVTITADKLVLNAHSTKGRVEAINVGTQGQQNKDNPMKLTINGDTEMNVKGINYTLGLYAAGNADVTFNGNVTAMGDKDSEWGLTSEKGAYGYYGCSLVYSGSNYSLQMGPKVTINGDVNAKIDGNCLFANGGHAKLTINGGGNIEINKDNTHNYYALLAESATTSLNVNLDDNYQATSARDNKLVLKGNVTASTGAVNANEPEPYTYVNLGLATADSEWTGVAYNKFGDAGKTTGGKTFYGAINVFLQNGATWNNEEWGTVEKSAWGAAAYNGSHLAKLIGGSDAAHAGNIFQKDANSLTIDNYSGNTNIYYAHTGNGEAVGDYAAGDTIIKSAAKDSVVSLITDSQGITMSDESSVTNVLNALAGKLTYSNFTKSENNLTGYVKIADGLTSSSKIKQAGNIAFSTENGKGSYADGTMTPGFAPDHQVKTAFTTTLTGVNESDIEYFKGGVIAEDGSYKFTEDSSITTTNAHGADMNQATTIDAKGKTLTFNTNITDSSTIHAIGANSTDGVTITADKLVLNAHSTKGRVEAINVGTQGQQNKDNPMKLTINGDTEMNVKGINYTLGLYAAGNADVTFNGNVTAMGDKDSEWGLTSEKGAYGYYGCSLVYSGSNYSLQMGPKVTINGDVNAKIDGNCLFANGGHAKLTINGGGNIEINKDNTHNYYALLAESATTSLNVNLDDNYQATSARDNKLVLKGNVTASTGAVNANEPEPYTYVNLGLATADSEWTGVAYNKFGDAGKTTGGKTFYGAINVFLQNGATWNNEEWGTVEKSAWGAAAYNGSHLAKLIGGSDAAHAGNIFQKDANSLTIDNYSGNTNIYYAHTGNGEAASDYAAGDTIIRSAAEGSVVSLITDNKDVNMNSADSIVNVLNSLAGKLTYSNFTKDENNLTGYVKIADGLTSSSAAMYTGDMAFSKEDGKGSLKDEDGIRPFLPAPDSQISNEFTTTLDGVSEKDQEYHKAGVIKGEGLYQFTQNSSITTTNAHGSDMNQATTIDAKGKTLTFNTNITDRSTIHAIGANSTDGVTITADKLVLNAHSTKGRVEAINVGTQGQQNKDNPMKLTINGDTEMNVKGINYTLGLYAAGNADVTFNGNVTAMGDKDSEWGLTSEKGAYGYYGCSLVYSGSNYSLQMGPKVTINGDVNAKIDGNCLFANGGHAKLTINGGGNIEINKDNTHNYYALLAESATTSLNVNLDDNYQATSARDNKLVLKGNVTASTGAVNANEPEPYTYVNLGLATADSEWTGVAYNKFGDAGKTTGGKTFYGAINVFLQNGATWNNEEWGTVEKSAWGAAAYNGSHLAKLIGGSDAAHAGNIFQKDANSLTIDNYSGNTNIYYAHTGNGEAASDYAAGDTIIRSAAAGSVVSLITDNSGIAMDNEYSVANVLNTLAGKLTYSNFTKGEKNLAGYVKIADGLTASSAAMQTGNIAFDTESGKGSLESGSMKPGFTYPDTQKPEVTEKNQGITGDAKTDYQYKKDGILKEDGSYVFTQDPTKIEVESGAAVEATNKDINIDSTQAKLELKGETGINANDADVTIKGNTGISGDVGINAENGNVTLNGSTDIAGTDAAITAGEGGNVTISGQNGSLNGAVNINGAIVAEGADSKVSIDSSKATGIINGDITATNGAHVEVKLDGNNSKLIGGYNIDDDSTIVINIQNGATWELNDYDDDAETYIMDRAGAGVGAGFVLKGGATEEQIGHTNMNQAKDLEVASWNGWIRFAFKHIGDGSNVSDYVTTKDAQAGNVVIANAAAGSGVILSTDNNGINMDDKAAVEATLKALAQKVTYKDYEATGDNLSGKVQIADGLTSSSVSKYLGTLHWDENGVGQYDLDSIKWKEIYNGNYETFVMKGVRSAATTSMHSWRDNMQDTYTGADLADEDGIFAKALGGKTSSDVKGVRDDNTYRGVQVGFDKALANGWHAGVAFDYRNGDSNYLLGGKGDNQLYSLGVYGVKNFEDQSYLRVAAKAGRVENEYDVYNETRRLKLHGDYKSNAYGLTMEYGKTFGSEASYFTPKAQLTWSQVGSKDYTAHTPNDSMRIDQDAYSSLVARFGVEAGAKSEKGRVYVGLYGAHEFNGDITASYFAKDGGYKHTSFDGSDTWMEMSIGGSYDLSDNCHIYADFAKDFGGDFERKWKASAGLRFEF